MTTRQIIDKLNKEFSYFIFEHRRNAYKTPLYPFIVRHRETKKIVEKFKTLADVYRWLGVEEKIERKETTGI